MELLIATSHQAAAQGTPWGIIVPAITAITLALIAAVAYAIANKPRVEDMGSWVAELRERVSELEASLEKANTRYQSELDKLAVALDHERQAREAAQKELTAAHLRLEQLSSSGISESLGIKMLEAFEDLRTQLRIQTETLKLLASIRFSDLHGFGQAFANESQHVEAEVTIHEGEGKQ